MTKPLKKSCESNSQFDINAPMGASKIAAEWIADWISQQVPVPLPHACAAATPAHPQ
jgi:hypothetical protein